MFWLNVAAGTLGLLGTGILAFSLNGVLNELRFCVGSINTSIESIASGGSIYVFRGLKQRLVKAQRESAIAVWAGLGLVAVAFVLQVIAAVMSSRVAS